MSLYAIADLHLSFNNPKPMNIFGNNWDSHEEKIKKDWESKVEEEDTVLLLGDFSWATYLHEAYKDFEYLNSLPGRKILLKGNHDYWWTTLTRMRRFLKENNFNNIDFLYNNSCYLHDYIIVGTRGWSVMESGDSMKILERELGRLKLSLEDGARKHGDEKPIIVCMHYPPVTNSFLESNEEKKFLNLMKEYNVKKCLYGHLHGASHKNAVEGNIEGIDFQLISADYINFKLVKLAGKE